MSELALSLVVTLVLAPVVRAIMIRYGVLDVPNRRSSHSVATPRGGGLACVVGSLVAGTVAWLRGDDLPISPLLAAAALAVVGFADDRADVPAVVRLGCQVGVGLCLGAALGGGMLLVLGGLLVPVLVNAVNFMDGINGITSLTMAIWGITALVVGQSEEVASLTTIGGLAAGAALGFLPWNVPKARLFLGDVGSYFFGGLLAGGVCLAVSRDLPLMVLLSPCLPYLADTGVTILQRAMRKERLFEAHRQHTYQKVVDLGASHLTVSVMVAVCAALCAAFWLTLDPMLAGFLSLIVCSLYIASPSIARVRMRLDGLS